MPFAPWLKQPEPDEDKPHDPDDPSLLVNVLKDELPSKKEVDWFIDHLVAEEPPKDR